MNEWETIFELSCEHNQIGDQIVDASGDWSASISKVSKAQVDSREAAVANVLAEYELRELEEQELNRRVQDIKTFKDGLRCNRLEIQDCSQLCAQFNIQEICFFETLVDDGNTTISIMEDASAFYCIFFETS